MAKQKRVRDIALTVAREVSERLAAENKEKLVLMWATLAEKMSLRPMGRGGERIE